MKKQILLIIFLLLPFSASIARVKLNKKTKPNKITRTHRNRSNERTSRGRLTEHWKCAAAATAAVVGTSIIAYKLGKANIKNQLGIVSDSELHEHGTFTKYQKAATKICRPLYLYLIGDRIEGAADSKETQMVLRETGKEDLRYLYKAGEAARLKPRR